MWFSSVKLWVSSSLNSNVDVSFCLGVRAVEITRKSPAFDELVGCNPSSGKEMETGVAVTT